MKARVILDTNFFMIPYADRIDIFEEIHRLILGEYELITLESVVEELTELAAKGRGKEKVAANVGLGLLEHKKVAVTGEKTPPNIRAHADKDIIKYISTQGKGAIVCTNDRELRKAAKDLGAQVISMRGRKHLAFV